VSIINIILGDAALCKVAPKREGLKNLEKTLFGFTLYIIDLHTHPIIHNSAPKSMNIWRCTHSKSLSTPPWAVSESTQDNVHRRDSCKARSHVDSVIASDQINCEKAVLPPSESSLPHARSCIVGESSGASTGGVVSQNRKADVGNDAEVTKTRKKCQEKCSSYFFLILTDVFYFLFLTLTF
jgi:hypothetical protein